MSQGKFSDLSGKTFGRLTVSHRVGTKHGHALWGCVCECGKEVEVRANSLNAGHSTSCGCYRDEVSKINGASMGTHRMSSSPEYALYQGMKRRCYSTKEVSYERYGAKGITVCDRWLESFENFYEDMGAKPSPNHTLERLDGELGYGPENVVWATTETQMRNRKKMGNNTSGKTGVSKSCRKSGDHWIAFYRDMDTNKQVSKGFSVKKYGYDEAYRLACEFRDKAIEDMNKRGAGYSDKHGL